MSGETMRLRHYEPELRLDTTVQQEAAQGLYVKNGYREVRHARMYGFGCIFYEKSDLASPDVSGTSYGIHHLG